MKSTVSSPVSTSTRRTVYYQAGEGIELNYTQLRYRTEPVYISRQQIKRHYFLTFRFMIVADDSQSLANILTTCERVLMMRGGILTVQDGNVTIFNARPCSTQPTVLTTISGGDAGSRNAILQDIEWGPSPVSFEVEGFLGAFAATALWTVRVTTAAEDAFLYRDPVVLGIDAEVSYHIDQDHYTTRLITGRIFGMNFGRAGQGLGRSPMSFIDQEAIRYALLANAGSSQNNFMDPIRIPPNFIREREDFHVSATENELHITIVDREVYRTPPANMTRAEARMTVHIGSASAVQYVRHELVGRVEAPRDIKKVECLAAAWDIISAGMPFLSRMTRNDMASFVQQMTWENDFYRNAIAFRIVAFTPFGAFDFLNSLGVGEIPSDVYIAQGTAGSASLFGSAYRTEFGKYTKTHLTKEIARSIQEGTAFKKNEMEHAKQRENDAKKLFGFQLAIELNLRSTILEATPNTRGAISSIYQNTNNAFDFILRVKVAQAVDRKKIDDKVDYYSMIVNEIKEAGDLVIVDQRATSKTARSAWQTIDKVSDVITFRIKIIGETRKKVTENGLYAAVSAFNSSAGQLSDLDKLSEELRKMFELGTGEP